MNREDLKELVKQHFNLVESTPENFSDATLEDGTKVTNDKDGDFAVGQDLFVIDEEGNKVAAPEGEHVTKSGIQLIVDAEGKLTGVKYPDAAGEGSADLAEEDEEEMESKDEKMAEAKEEEALEVEEEMEEEEDKMEVELPRLEEIIEVIGEVVEEKMAEVKEDIKAKVEKMEEKIEEIKEKMSQFAAEPADSKTLPGAKKFSKNDGGRKSRNSKAYDMALKRLNNK